MKRIRNYRMSKGRRGNLRHKNLGHLETAFIPYANFICQHMFFLLCLLLTPLIHIIYMYILCPCYAIQCMNSVLVKGLRCAGKGVRKPNRLSVRGGFSEFCAILGHGASRTPPYCQFRGGPCHRIVCIASQWLGAGSGKALETRTAPSYDTRL